jgi:predicted ATP-dependent protease
VGGLNEKIEAFYDLCAAKGLSGKQGVIVPEHNRDALMLRGDVVEAIAKGTFHVYAISTVEEGIELLTGVTAGIADDDGHYLEGTLFRAAETRLKRFHQAMGEVYRAGGNR